MGHGSLDTTKLYLRLVPGRLKEDYDLAMPEIATGLPTRGLHPITFRLYRGHDLGGARCA